MHDPLSTTPAGPTWHKLRRTLISMADGDCASPTSKASRSELLTEICAVCTTLERNHAACNWSGVAECVTNLQLMGPRVLDAAALSFIAKGPTRLALRGRDALLLVSWAVQDVRRRSHISLPGGDSVVAAFARGMVPALKECIRLLRDTPTGTPTQARLATMVLEPVRDSWERLRSNLVQSAVAGACRRIDDETRHAGSAYAQTAPPGGIKCSTIAESSAGFVSTRQLPSLPPPLWASLLAGAATAAADTSVVFRLAESLGKAMCASVRLSIALPGHAARARIGLLAVASPFGVAHPDTASSIVVTVAEGLWSGSQSWEAAHHGEGVPVLPSPVCERLVRNWVSDVAANLSHRQTEWLSACLRRRAGIAGDVPPWNLEIRVPEGKPGQLCAD